MSDSGVFQDVRSGSAGPSGDYRSGPDGFCDSGPLADSTGGYIPDRKTRFIQDLQKAVIVAADQNEARDYRWGQLQAQKEVMIRYIHLKLAEEDWHGVQDAASDLRDIASELKGLAFGRS